MNVDSHTCWVSFGWAFGVFLGCFLGAYYSCRFALRNSESGSHAKWREKLNYIGAVYLPKTVDATKQDVYYRVSAIMEDFEEKGTFDVMRARKHVRLAKDRIENLERTAAILSMAITLSAIYALVIVSPMLAGFSSGLPVNYWGVGVVLLIFFLACFNIPHASAYRELDEIKAIIDERTARITELASSQ